MVSEPNESVLVPANVSIGAVQCVRSLGRRGVNTIVASENQHVPAFRSTHCDEAVLVPSPHDDLLAYRDALLTLARRRDVRTVCPVREEDVFVLSRYRSMFEPHVSVVAPSFESLRTVHDGYALATVAADAGVPVPRTTLLSEAHDWDERLIVKSRYSILTSDYVETHAPSECDKLQGRTTQLEPSTEPDRAAIREEMLGHDPIVQEWVPVENEYMYAALYDHGEELSSWQQRYIRRKSYGAGGSVFRESTYDPTLEAHGRALLEHLDWHGIACIEFMKDAETGEFKLTEINPRLWMSIPCAVRAGADFPWHHWLLATGARDRIERGYDLGVRTHSLYGEAHYLLSLVLEEFPYDEKPALLPTLWEVSKSMVTDPYFDFLTRDDPMPFVSGLLIAAHAQPVLDRLNSRVVRKLRVNTDNEAHNKYTEDREVER